MSWHCPEGEDLRGMEDARQIGRFLKCTTSYGRMEEDFGLFLIRSGHIVGILWFLGPLQLSDLLYGLITN